MFGIIARLIGKKLLGSKDIKKRIMDALIKEAARTETTIDDNAVTIFGEVYDVVVPILIGEL